MTQSETLCQQSIQRGGAADGKDTMGWCHGFKLHLLCNDRGEIITFCFCKDTILRTQNNCPYSKIIPNSGILSNKGANAPSLPNKGLPALSCSIALFLILSKSNSSFINKLC